MSLQKLPDGVVLRIAGHSVTEEGEEFEEGAGAALRLGSNNRVGLQCARRIGGATPGACSAIIKLKVCSGFVMVSRSQSGEMAKPSPEFASIRSSSGERQANRAIVITMSAEGRQGPNFRKP